MKGGLKTTAAVAGVLALAALGIGCKSSDKKLKNAGLPSTQFISAHSASAQPPMQLKAAQLDSAAYRRIADSTSNFKFTGKDAEDVRRFLENGGMYRTEKRPASKKEFSTVLYFDSAVSLQTGTKNEVVGQSQAPVATYTDIEPGVYIFNYDTESGLTLRKMGESKEVLKVALKPEDSYGLLEGGALKINVTAHSGNLKTIMGAIKNTVKLYGENSQMAALMEMALDALYAKGNFGAAAPFSEAMQSEAGKAGAKEVLRAIMGNMEESLLRNLSEMLASTTVSGWGALWNHDKRNVDMARRELLATNATTDNLLVSFGVENGRIVAEVYIGTEFDKGQSSYNPVLLFRIIGVPEGKPGFPNGYERDFRGMVDGADFDNKASGTEKGMETTMTEQYDRATGKTAPYMGPNEVKLFVLHTYESYKMMEEAFKAGYAKEMRQQ